MLLGVSELKGGPIDVSVHAHKAAHNVMIDDPKAVLAAIHAAISDHAAIAVKSCRRTDPHKRFSNVFRKEF